METPEQKWDRELLEVLRSAVGERLAEVWVNEMGLYGPDEAPSFTHPQLKFVQAQILELRLESGGALWLGVFQDDYEWAIWPARLSAQGSRLEPDQDPSNTLFRTRCMPEFPLGQITAAAPEFDERGNIQKITLAVGAREVILKAAEVYEDIQGRLKIVERDESVLVFLDPQDYAETIFGEAVYSTG